MRGFTLVELLVTVAIVGTLSAMAMPSLRDLVRNQRIKTAASDVYASLVYARSESIKRGQFVSLCASTDGAACAGATDWATGWIVFVDPDGDGAPAAAADIVKKQDAFAAVTLTGTLSGLSYQRDGRLVAAGSFTVSASGAGASPRCVSISLSGQPNIKSC